jgi:regulator of protease activity HflC (stomatin/prohibitin superfamily)
MTKEECVSAYGTFNSSYCDKYESVPQNPIELVGGFFGWFLGNVWVLLIIAALLVIVAMSTKIIREKEIGLVERFGRFNRVLSPGAHFVIPVIERVIHRAELPEVQLNVATSVKTKDQQLIKLPVAVTLRIIDLNAFYYELEPLRATISKIVSKDVKVKAANMTLENIFEDRDSIEIFVYANLGSKIGSWGLEVTSVVVKSNDAIRDIAESGATVVVNTGGAMGLAASQL